MLLISAWKLREQGGSDAEPRRTGLQEPLSTPGDIAELVRQGKKIQAIKRYRALNPQLRLKEAKEHIDLISLTTEHDRKSHLILTLVTTRQSAELSRSIRNQDDMEISKWCDLHVAGQSFG